MNAPALPTLPERQRQAREIARLRSALLKDRDLCRGWANSVSNVRPGQAAVMLRRVEELNQLLNAAPSPPPDVPALARAAEATQGVNGLVRAREPETAAPETCP